MSACTPHEVPERQESTPEPQIDPRGQRIAPRPPVLTRKPLAHIVTFWKVGSRDHSWADEYAELMHPANEVTAAILARVDSEGIDFADDHAPVMLGSDGRVWDGHHRICIALRRGITHLMCEVVR